MGIDCTRPEARRIWPREKSRVERRRNVNLLIVHLRSEEESLAGEVAGARRSERVPVRSRAMVDVRATMETWVAGELALGTVEEGG